MVNKTESLRSGIRDMVVGATGAAGFAGLIDVAKNYAEQMQTLGVQFGSTFGGQAAGGAELRQAAGFADQMGISVAASASALQNFALATRGSGIGVQQLNKDMKDFADIAAGTGQSIDQVSAQIGNFLQLAQRTGTTSAARALTPLLTSYTITTQQYDEIQKMVAGGANAQTVASTILADAEKAYGGAGQKQAETLGNRFQTFRNEVEQGIGGALSPIMGGPGQKGGISAFLGDINTEMQTPGFEHLVSQIKGDLAPLGALFADAGEKVTAFFQRLSTPAGVSSFKSEFAWVGSVVTDLEHLGAAAVTIGGQLVAFGASAAHAAAPLIGFAAGIARVVTDIASFAAHSVLAVHAIEAIGIAFVAIKIGGWLEAASASLLEFGSRIQATILLSSRWGAEVNEDAAMTLRAIDPMTALTTAINLQTTALKANLDMLIARDGALGATGAPAGLLVTGGGAGSAPAATTTTESAMGPVASMLRSPMMLGLLGLAAGAVLGIVAQHVGGGQTGPGKALGFASDVALGAGAGAMLGMPELGAAVGAVVGSLNLMKEQAASAAAALAKMDEASNKQAGRFFVGHPIGTTAETINASYHAANAALSQGTASASAASGVPASELIHGYFMALNNIPLRDHLRGLQTAQRQAAGAEYNLNQNAGTLQQLVPGLTRAQAISQEEGAGIDPSSNISRTAAAIHTLADSINGLGGATEVASQAIQNSLSTISNIASGQAGGQQSFSAADLFQIKAGQLGFSGPQGGQQLAQQVWNSITTPNAATGYTGVNPANYGFATEQQFANYSGPTPQQVQQESAQISTSQGVADALHGVVEAQHAVIQAGWQVVDANNALVAADHAREQAAWALTQADFQKSQADFQAGRAAFQFSVTQTTASEAQAAFASALSTQFLPAMWNAASTVQQLTGADQALGQTFMQQVSVLQGLQTTYDALTLSYQAAASNLQVLNDQLKALQDVTNQPLVGSKAQQQQEQNIKQQIAGWQAQQDTLALSGVPSASPQMTQIGNTIAILQKQLDLITAQANEGPGNTPNTLAGIVPGILTGMQSAFTQANAQTQVQNGPNGGLAAQAAQINIDKVNASLEVTYPAADAAAKSIAALQASIVPATLALDQSKGPLDAITQQYNVQNAYVQQLNTALTTLSGADQTAIDQANGMLTAANAQLTAGQAVQTAGWQATTAQQAWVDAGHGVQAAGWQAESAATVGLSDAASAFSQANLAAQGFVSSGVVSLLNDAVSGAQTNLTNLASDINTFVANLAITTKLIQTDLNNITFLQGVAQTPQVTQAEAQYQQAITTMEQTGQPSYPSFQTNAGSPSYAQGGFTGYQTMQGAPSGVAGYVHTGEFVLSADMLSLIPGWQNLVSSPDAFASLMGRASAAASAQATVAGTPSGAGLFPTFTNGVMDGINPGSDMQTPLTGINPGGAMQTVLGDAAVLQRFQAWLTAISQGSPLPTYALGGYTGGTAYAPGGIAGLVHTGEFVLGSDTLQRIQNGIPVILNGSSGPSVTIAPGAVSVSIATTGTMTAAEIADEVSTQLNDGLEQVLNSWVSTGRLTNG